MGSDRLLSELYKTVPDTLSPYSLNMFSQALENGSLALTLNKAVITLIPKKSRDSEEVRGYRRTSPLNVIQKILAKP